MPPPKNKLIIAAVIGFLFLVFIVLVVFSFHKGSKNSDQPPSPAISVVTAYLQARENNVGADQADPTSWLAAVKPLATTSWFNQLQPVSDPQTSSTSNDYSVAHDSGYKIKANVSNCKWQNKSGIVEATATSGTIICALSDTTINQSSGEAVPADSLPYGWVHNGAQLAPVFEMVKQNGQWLVNNDATGLGQ